MKQQKFHYRQQRNTLAWLVVVAPYVVFGVACAINVPVLGLAALVQLQRSAVVTLNRLEPAPAPRRCRHHVGTSAVVRPCHRSAARSVRCEG